MDSNTKAALVSNQTEADADVMTESGAKMKLQSRKRRLSTVENDAGAVHKKKILLDAEPNGAQPATSMHLLEFSDEILLAICQNLSSADLHNLSKLCHRLQDLVFDQKLWKTFDFSSQRLMAKEIVQRLVYVTGKTKHVHVRGFAGAHPLPKWKNVTITANILWQLCARAPALETLSIRQGYFNLEKISVNMFPTTLKRLLLIDCQINMPRPARWMQAMSDHLPNLEEVSMELCPWFETHDILVFSKLPNLKKLCLRGCLQLRDFVPYGSICSRFGFKKLHTLDVRHTGIGDSDLQCMNIIFSLRVLLLDCPPHRVSKPIADGSIEEIPDEIMPPYDDDNDHEYGIPSDSESVHSTGDTLSSDDDSDDDDTAPSTAIKPMAYFKGDEQAQKVVSVSLMGGNNAENGGAAGGMTLKRREINGVVCYVGVMNGAPTPRPAVQAQAGPPAAAPNGTAEVQANGGASSSHASTSTAPSTSAGPSSVSPSEPSTSSAGGSPAMWGQPARRQQSLARIDETRSMSRSSIIAPVATSSSNPQHQIIIIRSLEAEQSDSPSATSRSLSAAVTFAHNCVHNARQPSTTMPSISDRGIMSFGIANESVASNIIWIGGEKRPRETLLEVLLLRNYRNVTDRTLLHLEMAAPNLRYLDVSGTSVTAAGLQRIRAAKPNCRIISSDNKTGKEMNF